MYESKIRCLRPRNSPSLAAISARSPPAPRLQKVALRNARWTRKSLAPIGVVDSHASHDEGPGSVCRDATSPGDPGRARTPPSARLQGIVTTSPEENAGEGRVRQRKRRAHRLRLARRMRARRRTQRTAARSHDAPRSSSATGEAALACRSLPALGFPPIALPRRPCTPTRHERDTGA